MQLEETPILPRRNTIGGGMWSSSPILPVVKKLSAFVVLYLEKQVQANKPV